MKFSRAAVCTTMKETGMVPVFYHSDIEIARSVIDAAYSGGVRVFEFTNRGKQAFDVFTQLLDYITRYPDLILGIGTIMDESTTSKFIQAGAHFIVSPVLKPEMAKVCHEHDILWIPGCATLTEIVTAKEAGAEIVKLFPGSVLGPQFVSAVLPVVSTLQLMPTGGVEPTPENLSKWFNAGVACVGMGSALITKQILTERNWRKLQADIANTMATIKTIRTI